MITFAIATPTVEMKEGRFIETNTGLPYNGPYDKHFEGTNVLEWEGVVENGLADGVWSFYYRNGSLKSIVEFEEGVKLRTLKSWFENGVLESYFDTDSFTYTMFYKSGVTRSHTHYNQNLRQGNSKEWYESGQLKRECNYYYHHEHGVCKEYYEDGSVSLVAVYRDGKKNGFWQAFYPDGRLLYQGRYSDDFKTGKWVIRDEVTGKLKKKYF